MAVQTGEQERSRSSTSSPHGSPATTCVSGGNGPSGLSYRVTPAKAGALALALPPAPAFPAACAPRKEVCCTPHGTVDSKALRKTPQALGETGP